MSNVLAYNREVDDFKHEISRSMSKLSVMMCRIDGDSSLSEVSDNLLDVLSAMKKTIISSQDEIYKGSKRYDEVRSKISILDESSNLVDSFSSLYKVEDVFSENLELCVENIKEHANVVFGMWFRFSEVMPKVLSKIASKYDCNEERACAIQIAHEELGEGQLNHIHCNAFKRVGEKIGLRINQQDNCESLNKLSNFVDRSSGDKELLGLGLGLEIIANENISTIFNYLSYDDLSKDILERSYFFKTHFVNEDGHIAENINNYRFCETEEDKVLFLKGFFNGLDFWQEFWSEVLVKVKQ